MEHMIIEKGLRGESRVVWLGQRKQVCLHECVPGNEAADELAGRGWDLSNPSSSVSSHSEIHSLHRTKTNVTWRNSPAHHWYAARSPGLSLQCRSSRAHQTSLARFRSSHLRDFSMCSCLPGKVVSPLKWGCAPQLEKHCSSMRLLVQLGRFGKTFGLQTVESKISCLDPPPPLPVPFLPK
ncbi:uncharacterized protein TNCV_844561 [Trichonephila clavipes]|uniref:RNase H type-1 domain-containing protein n=1 Tax=Trichonephila clavipes TaxID=2585209 RepID=A0A8X7BLH1_TRICX|nr:uncharacterized protein TNCV_844561 [Trichonephila clavipes]